MEPTDLVDNATEATNQLRLNSSSDEQPQNPPVRKIPRSMNSICVALDELDQELDEEELSEAMAPINIFRTHRLPPPSASINLVSHPLDFTDQFPHVAVVTTAALPWLTGTAVNPALRAAYLQKRGHQVTLLVPWVVPAVQPRLFPEGVTFLTHEQQKLHIQDSIRRRVSFSVDFTQLSIIFYPGRYDSAMGSIMPTADIQQLVPHPVHCIVLEEPEHLTWYHTGHRWTRAFHPTPVVGVMHTNYVDYIRRSAGEATAGLISRLNKYLCRMHTHKVIKLSNAVQTLPRQETCFVHGVAYGFLEVGETTGKAVEEERGQEVFTRGAYFLGKALWAKGFQELVERLQEHQQWCTTTNTPIESIDVYSKGEQLEAIKSECTRLQLPVRFHGGRDHMDPEMQSYRCFVNPSTSDVVATTSAEALAMGKWLVVPKHPCNVFFESFKNCLIYSDAEEFSQQLHKALTNFPKPLTAEERSTLSWESATDRFLHCCAQTEVEKGSPLGRVAAKTTWVGYNVIVGAMESVRKALTVGSTQSASAHRVASSGDIHGSSSSSSSGSNNNRPRRISTSAGNSSADELLLLATMNNANARRASTTNDTDRQGSLERRGARVPSYALLHVASSGGLVGGDGGTTEGDEEGRRQSVDSIELQIA